MPEKQLGTRGRGIKQAAIAQIADHILEAYRPKDGPIVLMWRDTMNGFHLKRDPDYHCWPRDDQQVHSHWKRYGAGVVEILGMRDFTVVKVNRHIRELVGHGRSPDRSEKKSDARYIACLPSSSHMVFGIVLFPRDKQEDHPLIVASRRRRASTASTAVGNSVLNVRKANDLGNLSETASGEILAATKERVDQAFVDPYPLFSKLPAVPLPPPAPPALEAPGPGSSAS